MRNNIVLIIRAHIKNLLQLKNRWTKKSTVKEHSSKNHFDKAICNNPYLQSKALWNDVYGDLNQRYLHSRWVQYGLIVIIGLLVIGLIILASETKIRSVPFIVQGDEVLTLHHTLDINDPKLRAQLAPYFAKQFIRAARAVSVDRAVNRTHAMMAYAFVANAAVSVLHDFYKTEQQRHDITQVVNSIVITSVLPLSAHTLEIHWREVWRNANTGEQIKTEHYLAQLTYDYRTSSQNTLVLGDNPLGFYITSLSWALDNTV